MRMFEAQAVRDARPQGQGDLKGAQLTHREGVGGLGVVGFVGFATVVVGVRAGATAQRGLGVVGLVRFTDVVVGVGAGAGAQGGVDLRFERGDLVRLRLPGAGREIRFGQLDTPATAGLLGPHGPLRDHVAYLPLGLAHAGGGFS